jgi:adenylate kinase family enzyme
MHRVHIVGGPGSGKTTLARRLGDVLDVQAYDLDAVAYPAHRKRPGDERRAEAERIAAGEG